MKKLLVLLILLLASTASADWELKRSVNPMDDSVKVIAQRNQMGIVLAIVCNKKTLDVIYISAGQYVTDGFFDLEYRVDKGKIKSVKAYGMYGDSAYVLYSNVGDILPDLKSGELLFIRTTGRRGERVQQFSLKGAAATIQAVEDACK